MIGLGVLAAAVAGSVGSAGAGPKRKKALTWGIRAHDTVGAPIINESTNVLRRNGYVGLILVADPAELDAARVE